VDDRRRHGDDRRDDGDETPPKTVVAPTTRARRLSLRRKQDTVERTTGAPTRICRAEKNPDTQAPVRHKAPGSGKARVQTKDDESVQPARRSPSPVAPEAGDPQHHDRLAPKPDAGGPHSGTARRKLVRPSPPRIDSVSVTRQAPRRIPIANMAETRNKRLPRQVATNTGGD